MDSDGLVLATEDLIVSKPWEVAASSSYPGHFYFINTETNEAKWSISKELVMGKKNGDGKIVSPSAPAALRRGLFGRTRQISRTASRGPVHSNTNTQTSADSLDDHQNDSPDWYDRKGRPCLDVLAGLGEGGYATVVLVRSTSARAATQENLYAMKVLSKTKHKRAKDQTRLLRELKVMRDLAPSRFLERCHAAFESPTNVFFVCDYIAGGDLFYHMLRRTNESKWGFDEADCRILLAEVTLGLEHLHAQGFIHRDLKVENIMLDVSGHVKLIDFGLAVEIKEGQEEQPMTPTGSLIYMTPELIKSKKGGRHTDWWAMGILAFELSTGRTPWSSLEDRPLIKHEILKCVVMAPKNVSAKAAQFIGGLLQKNFRSRLGTARDSDLKKALFFQGLDWSAMARGETAPAFVCGPATVAEGDRRSALEAYIKFAPPMAASQSTEESSTRPAPWFLGVDKVTSHPKATGD